MRALWKTRFGYCIDQTADVYVYQNLLYRWLTFGSPAIQTLINRYHPHRYVLPYLKIFTLGVLMQPGSTCLLGLGGGGAIHAIRKSLHCVKFTAVELNMQVIHMAQQHFMLADINHLDIIHQDANLFMQTCNEPYQHILIDLYSDSQFPTSCQQAEFFYACQQHLRQDGMLSINLASHQDAWATLQLLRLHFGQRTLCVPIRGTANIVILATSSLENYFDRCLQHKAFKRIIWDANWGYLGL